MPPKAHIQPHLSLEDLKTRYRQTQDTTEARRWHLLMLVAGDWTIKQAAQVVGLNYDYAKEIVHRYNEEGPVSVRNRNSDRQPPPAKALLTIAQQEELRQALQDPPPDGGQWSGPKVARWIAEKTGNDHIWPQRGWDYLKRLGIKWRQRRKKTGVTARS
jgi:transposase